MSEERLEEVEQIVDDLINNRIELREFIQSSYVQAERARGLEEDLQLSEQEESSRWEELNRCRETLKFYANPNNYNETDNFMSNINVDSGVRASRELEGLE